MRDLFYGLLSFFLIGIIYIGYTMDRKVNLDHRKDGIVIHMSHDYITGNIIYIQMSNDSIYHEYVYQIAIKDLEVGDTIKIQKKYY